MPRWYDKEVERLEDDLDSGAITYAEFKEDMRELNAELDAAAEEEAEAARENYYNGW